jgi:WD40 repeat protein
MRIIGLLVAIILLVSGCEASENDSLPTRIPQEEPTAAGEAIPQGELPTESSTDPPPMPNVQMTLPPTWTPDIPPTPTPEVMDTAISAQSAPMVGTILYVFNGDSIIAIDPETGFNRLIVTLGVNQPIGDLTLSPAGDRIAFVSVGNGSAFEVYVADVTGENRRQVSCLGLGNVRWPTWSPDGQQITFAAAPGTNQPMNIYSLNVEGNCPEGNNQRLLIQTESTNIGGITYAPSGERIYFSNPDIFAYNLTTEVLSPPLTSGASLGANFNLTFSPTNPDLLVYLTDQEPNTQAAQFGFLVGLDVADFQQIEVLFDPTFTTTFYDWSSDGRTLLTSSFTDVALYDTQTRIGEQVIEVSDQLPFAVFGPDARQIAFIAQDPIVPEQDQIYLTDVDGTEPVQLTTGEGVINAIVWTPVTSLR